MFKKSTVIAVLAASLLAACAGRGLHSDLKSPGRGDGYGTVRMVRQVAGADGSMVHANYDYVVQLDNGDLMTYTYASDQGWEPGERLKAVDGKLARQQ
ncbi:MAG TPA: hypothetical protein VJ598_00595 [Albitalea sp.]|nr:hypothetical protein [Albitalea sp.]